MVALIVFTSPGSNEVKTITSKHFQQILQGKRFLTLDKFIVRSNGGSLARASSREAAHKSSEE